jgi:hypothetical protein
VAAETTFTPIEALLYSNSYGEVFTSLSSSALDNQTPIFSGHSYQKTMGTLAGYIAWLICSFHLNLPL